MINALQDTPSQTVRACQRHSACAPEWFFCHIPHPAAHMQPCHTLLFCQHGRRQQKNHIPERPAGTETSELNIINFEAVAMYFILIFRPQPAALSAYPRGKIPSPPA